MTKFKVHKLVSNQINVATNQDPRLQNAWGIIEYDNFRDGHI